MTFYNEFLFVLKVDPKDEESVVGALYTALEMTVKERKKRMEILQETVQTRSAERFLQENIKSIYTTSQSGLPKL